jgi:hypothetical protein
MLLLLLLLLCRRELSYETTATGLLVFVDAFVFTNCCKQQQEQLLSRGTTLQPPNFRYNSNICFGRYYDRQTVVSSLLSPLSQLSNLRALYLSADNQGAGTNSNNNNDIINDKTDRSVLTTISPTAATANENNNNRETILRQEAQDLLEKARVIRKQLQPQVIDNNNNEIDDGTIAIRSTTKSSTAGSKKESAISNITLQQQRRHTKWNVPRQDDDLDVVGNSSSNSNNSYVGYRIYLDIGREDGVLVYVVSNVLLIYNLFLLVVRKRIIIVSRKVAAPITLYEKI